MTQQRMIELLILKDIVNSAESDETYKNFLETNYDLDKLNNRYLELGKEFLSAYRKTEKSE